MEKHIAWETLTTIGVSVFLWQWCAPYTFGRIRIQAHIFFEKVCRDPDPAKKASAGPQQEKSIGIFLRNYIYARGRKTTYSSQFPLSRICCCWGLKQKIFFSHNIHHEQWTTYSAREYSIQGLTYKIQCIKFFELPSLLN